MGASARAFPAVSCFSARHFPGGPRCFQWLLSPTVLPGLRESLLSLPSRVPRMVEVHSLWSSAAPMLSPLTLFFEYDNVGFESFPLCCSICLWPTGNGGAQTGGKAGGRVGFCHVACL